MQYQYCIFDMDGTLVDSTGYWHDLQYEYLRSKGVAEADIARIVPITQPMTTLESGEYYIRELGFTCTAEESAAETDAMMAEHYRHHVPMKPGAMAFLDRLQAQGVKMCVASATSMHLLDICIERLGLGKYFEFVLSCAEIGSGKEQPDVFLEAAKRMGAAPAQCAVYEDSLIAITTARAAGFYTIGVYDEEAAGNWEAIQATAHEHITHWMDVL